MENKKAWTITLSLIAVFLIGSFGAAYLLVPDNQKPPIIIIDDNDTKPPVPKPDNNTPPPKPIDPVEPNDTKPDPEPEPKPPIIIIVDNDTDVIIPPDVEPLFQHNFSERTVLDN